MRNICLDFAALTACAVQLAACGDDASPDPTVQVTSATITATGQMTTTTRPGRGRLR